MMLEPPGRKLRRLDHSETWELLLKDGLTPHRFMLLKSLTKSSLPLQKERNLFKSGPISVKLLRRLSEKLQTVSILRMITSI